MRVVVWFLVLVVLLPSCKKKPEEAQVSEPTDVAPQVEIPKEAQREFPTTPEEIYPKAIDAVDEVKGIVRQIDDVKFAIYKGEPKEVSKALLEQVRSTIEGESPLDNKILLLYKLASAQGKVDHELLAKVLEDTRSEESVNELLAFSIGVLARRRMWELIEEEGGLAKARDEDGRLAELAKSEFYFFEKAYKQRQIEPIYAYALIGAYYDRALFGEPSRPTKKKLLEQFKNERIEELFSAIENSGGMRSILSPPWLSYEVDLGMIPPTIYNDAEIWGAWVTSAKDPLLLILEDALGGKDFDRTAKLIMFIRFIVNFTPVTIEGIRYSADTIKELTRIFSEKTPAHELRRKAAEIHKRALKEYPEWISKANEYSKRKKLQLANKNPTLALGEEKNYEANVYVSLVKTLDDCEDINRELIRERKEAEKARGK